MHCTTAAAHTFVYVHRLPLGADVSVPTSKLCTTCLPTTGLALSLVSQPLVCRLSKQVPLRCGIPHTACRLRYRTKLCYIGIFCVLTRPVVNGVERSDDPGAKKVTLPPAVRALTS